MLGITALSQSPISAFGGASAIISVSGQQATISTGIVGVKSSYLLTGQQINTSVGSVTIDSDQVILCPVYAAGESSKRGYNEKKFAELITKFSKTQVIIIENENDLSKYFRKNLINDEVVIGMGAGTISKWMYNLKNIL